jgi:hypothetical protein
MLRNWFEVYFRKYIGLLSKLGPVAIAERSEAWTVFDRSEAVIAGSNPALGMDV